MFRARCRSWLTLFCWLLQSSSLMRNPSSSISPGRTSGLPSSSSLDIKFFWRLAQDFALLPFSGNIFHKQLSQGPSRKRKCAGAQRHFLYRIRKGYYINFMRGIQLAELVLLICLFAVYPAFDGPVRDLVDGLPLPGVDVQWWSGYLSISRSTSFHYVLFSSKSDPDNDPVLLWLNGGPGCSSLIGMSYENGPFRFKTNSTDKEANPNSWNQKANLLYIESPGSVGFSIGNSNHSDETVQSDNLQALLTFYGLFPSLRSNPLYLSGESYAGIYVPWLALAIHEYNNKPTSLPINLKGLIVGNACTDPSECYTVGPNGTSLHQYEFLYRHGFYTEQDYTRMRAACVMAYDGDNCKRIRENLDKFFDSTKTSILNIYAKCYGLNSGSSEQKTKLYQSGRVRIVTGDLDCDDQRGALAFFNDPIVQQRLHISSSTKWQPCNDALYQSYKMNKNASYWIYPTLIKNYRVWIYSGDIDADVPVTGTRSWLNFFREEFHLPIMEPWREWWVPGFHKYDDQVGGMVWKLQNLTFVTVKNAGHMVPKDQPAAAYEMLQAFLDGKDLPEKIFTQ